MTYLMVDERVVIHMLLLVGNHAATKVALRPLALEDEVDLIACQSIVQRDDIVIQAAIGILLDEKIAHTDILVMSLFQTIEVERGILAHIRLYHLCSQEMLVICGMVAKEQLHLCSWLDDYQDAAIDHEQ